MDKSNTITVVIATKGRVTLARSIVSLIGQKWIDGDLCLVVGDGPTPLASELCEQFAGKLPLRYVENPDERGKWGHHARNWVINSRICKTSFMMALDDDDEYTPNAIEGARAAFDKWNKPRPHIFRMAGHPFNPLLWAVKEMRAGNFGTPCIAVPNDPARLGRYGMHYEGDFEFARSTMTHYPNGPVWSEHVVCNVRPNTA